MAVKESLVRERAVREGEVLFRDPLLPPADPPLEEVHPLGGLPPVDLLILRGIKLSPVRTMPTAHVRSAIVVPLSTTSDKTEDR